MWGVGFRVIGPFFNFSPRFLVSECCPRPGHGLTSPTWSGRNGSFAVSRNAFEGVARAQMGSPNGNIKGHGESLLGKNMQLGLSPPWSSKSASCVCVCVQQTSNVFSVQWQSQNPVQEMCNQTDCRVLLGSVTLADFDRNAWDVSGGRKDL